uniref:DNA-directed RNA polymerase subunit beta'' n=1 Tax=Pseudopediastrum boryanum TaxID=55410 RepID=A0A2U8GJ25_PSEBY|nr:RNA polymerase beta subunit [Pseudopediastrum boryanum]
MQKLIFLIKKNKLLSNKTNKLNYIKKRKLLSTNVLSVYSLFGIYDCSHKIKQKETSKNQKKNFFIKSTNTSIDNFNIFWNCVFDKGRLKSFVLWFLNTYGEYKTIELLEQLKNLGFGYATKAGVSLGIDDLKIPSQKFDLINQAESKIFKGIEKYKKGQITGVERLQQLIDVWNQTSEFLKQEVIRNFETTDLFNPVYMMAFSGARGNISQVRQLVGMRGLMSDPQGNIIDFPIQSNFREGLTLTEYIISTYGARKGIVDTALRTATAGYLTRRLVDVAQHVMISQFDCGTTRGIFLFDMKEGVKTIYSFQNRLIGRVLANDIEDYRLRRNEDNANSKVDFRSALSQSEGAKALPKHTNSKIDDNKESTVTFKKAYRNQEISSALAASIAKITKKAFVRSPLTCETRKLVCQLCYGWSLSSSKLVSLGEAVGVIAAQSIGEPGTQLTMRTFHTGGVFSGGLTNQIIAPYDGYVEYLDTIPGTCIRTPQGDISFLTKAQGSFFIKEKDFLLQENVNKLFKSEFYTIPAYAILFARNKQQVFKKQIVAQFSSIAQQQAQRGNAEQTVFAELEGEIAFSQIDLLEQQNEKLFEDIVLKAIDWSKIWILSGKIYYDPLGLNSFGINGDFFNRNTTFQKIYWHNLNSCFLDIPLKKQKNKNLIFKGIKRFSLTKNRDFFYKKRIINSTFNSSLLLESSIQNLHKRTNKKYKKLQQKENILNINIDNFNLNREKAIFFNKIPKNFYIKGFKNKLVLFLNQKLLYYFYINFKKENSVNPNNKKTTRSAHKQSLLAPSNAERGKRAKAKKLSYLFLMNTPFDIIKFLNKKTSLNNEVQQNFEIFSKSKINFSKFYNNKNARFFKIDDSLQLKKIKLFGLRKRSFTSIRERRSEEPIVQPSFGAKEQKQKMNQFQFEKIIKNNFLRNLKNMSYSKINSYNKNIKENSFYDLKLVGIENFYNIKKIEDDLKKSIIEKQKKKKIAKKIFLFNKKQKITNMVPLTVLLKNKPNSLYFYPFRTFIQFFLFKKINRIHFLSYYMKKTLKSSVTKKKKKLKSLLYDLNTTKQKNVKKLMNPFILKNSIPNFLKKKTIKKRIFSTLPELEDSLYKIYNFKKVKKTDIKNYSILSFRIFDHCLHSHSKDKAFASVKPLLLCLAPQAKEQANSKIGEKNSLLAKSKEKNKIHKKRINLQQNSSATRSLFGFHSFAQLLRSVTSTNCQLAQAKLLRKQKPKIDKNNANLSASLKLKMQKLQQSESAKEVKKQRAEKKAKNINSRKLNGFYKRKPILTLPVNKISFKKFGYIFSINNALRSASLKRSASESYASRVGALSRSEGAKAEPREEASSLKYKIKSDLILSYFPLTNSYNAPISSSTINDPGKNFQKLSLGNTLNFSPFSNIAFRWFPSDSQTISNGIYIWSRNFLINERTIGKEIKTYNKIYRENPDFYINNYYFVQKKRWIHLNGLFKKYNKKEIFDFNKYTNKLSQNMKNKNFLYINDYSSCFATRCIAFVQAKVGIFSLNSFHLSLVRFDEAFAPSHAGQLRRSSERPHAKEQSQSKINDVQTEVKEQSTKCEEHSAVNKRMKASLEFGIFDSKKKILYEKYGKKSSNLKFRYDLTLNQKLKIFVTKKYLKKLFCFNQSTFKEIENVLKIKTPFFNYITKFSKFSVYKQDFYYIPQENSKFNILNIKEHKFGTQLSPKFYLSNRQGFKKFLYSEVSGLTRIYTQTPNKKSTCASKAFAQAKETKLKNENFGEILINEDSVFSSQNKLEDLTSVRFDNAKQTESYNALRSTLPSLRERKHSFCASESKKSQKKIDKKKQEKEFLISCLYNNNLKNNFLISKKFDKKTIYPQNNKKHKNFISSIKIKKASYNMNLNIRNKMSSNILKKILKKQKNQKIEKNQNIKNIKCSNFYKYYDFNKILSNKKIEEKPFIAQLKNQLDFFSCIPFILHKKSFKDSNLLNDKIKLVNNSNSAQIGDVQTEAKQKQKKASCSATRGIASFGAQAKVKMKYKPFISTSQVERIKKPGWVYFLMDSYNLRKHSFCASESQNFINEFISLNSQSKGDFSVLNNNFLKSNEKLKIKNFLSFKFLHQTFVNEGKKVIHDICFEQNKIYIENVTLLPHSSFFGIQDCLRSVGSSATSTIDEAAHSKRRKLKNNKINISKLYTNNNCRFFDGFVSTMLFNKKNENISISFAECSSAKSTHSSIHVHKSVQKSKHEIKTNNLALLLRPIQHKILPNPQIFKQEISNNQKNSYNNYSILFYKDYHSNLLNLQNCHKKSLSKFPSVDFQIHQVSQNRKLNSFFDNQRITSSLIHSKYRTIKERSYNKKEIIIKKKLKNNIKAKILNKMKNNKSFITLYNKTSIKLKKQSYDKKVSFYMKKYSMYNKPYYFSNIFYSAYKIHSFSLELKNTTSYNLDFGFNIPTIILKPSYSNIIKKQNLHFLKRNYSISKLANFVCKQKKETNLSQMFYYLMKKNVLRKLWISKTVPNFAVDTYYNWFDRNKISSINLNSFAAFFRQSKISRIGEDEEGNQRLSALSLFLSLRSACEGAMEQSKEVQAKPTHTHFSDAKEDNLQVRFVKQTHIFSESYNRNVFRLAKQTSKANLNSFFALFYLYPFPFIEWSLTRKDDYLANSLLSSNKKIQNIKNCLFPNSYYKNFLTNNIKFQNFKNSILNYKQSGIVNLHTMNMQSFSFAFPRIKNSFLLYKAYNKILANQVYATTNLLSPFEGELLTQNNNNKWWNQSAETDLTHKKLDIKHYIFLTKKDMFSISLDLNSNAKMTKYIQQNKKMDINEYLHFFSTLYSNYNNLFTKNIKQQTQKKLFDKLKTSTLNTLNVHLNTYLSTHKKKKYNILNFVTKYQNKIYKLKGLSIGKVSDNKVSNLYLGKFLLRGDNISFDQKIDQTGQIIHLSSKKITLRYAQPFLISPKGILHVQQGDYVYRNTPVITLPFETLTTGDIVQGIPKVEQYLEARTTQNGRFFLYSLPVLQKAIFERYRTKLPLEQAVAQSFLKIQQIIVDGVQRVYRSQGVSIAEKHLEVIVKQMTSKVQIIHGGQTGFFPGELVDLEIVESVNKFLMVKIRYEPIVLGITRASLEVESFLSAASFQQTTKILAKASLSKKKDYLKGLKENLLVGNLIPAGTGFMNSYQL